MALDAVRGASLFGVLLVNVCTQFRSSSFDRFVPSTIQSSALDRAFERAIVALDTKPLVVFSLLFGLGLAAQQADSHKRIVRRLSFLFVLGALHFVFLWSGDVLALYAVIALVAAPLLRLSTLALFALALALFVVQVLPLPYPRPFPSFEAMQSHLDAARRVLGQGRYRDILAFRLDEARPYFALLVWTVPRTLGLFMLGACAWRAGLLSSAARSRLTRLASMLLVSGAALTMLPPHWPLAEASELGIALGAGALLFVIADHRRARPLLDWLAPIGRMTLTSYLVQSLVLGFVFYGYGLGLFGSVGYAASAGIAVALFAAQAVLAALGSKWFRLGPFEWLWRAFTKGTWHP